MKTLKKQKSEELYAIRRATYKGKSYYLLRERITNQDKRGYKLAFTDGSKTLQSLIAYAKSLKEAKESDAELCAECGRPGNLVQDWEDGKMKHLECCDMPLLEVPF